MQPLVSEFSLAMMSEDIGPRMYQLISSIHQHNHTDTANQDTPTFLTLPGSHLKMSNPALELAKTVCHVCTVCWHFLSGKFMRLSHYYHVTM